METFTVMYAYTNPVRFEGTEQQVKRYCSSMFRWAARSKWVSLNGEGFCRTTDYGETLYVPASVPVRANRLLNIRSIRITGLSATMPDLTQPNRQKAERNPTQ